jgi:hypothetical protein
MKSWRSYSGLDRTKHVVVLFLETGVEDGVRKYDYDPANAAVEFSIGCESETSRRHLPVSHRVNINRIHHGAATMAVHCLPLNAASGGGSKGQKGVSVWAVMLRCPFLSGARHDEAC